MYSIIWRGKRDRSIKNIVKYGNKQRRQYQKYSQALVENVGVGVAYAHQQVAERTVDVLTATLHGRVIRSIHQVNCHLGSLKQMPTYILVEL